MSEEYTNKPDMEEEAAATEDASASAVDGGVRGEAETDGGEEEAADVSLELDETASDGDEPASDDEESASKTDEPAAEDEGAAEPEPGAAKEPAGKKPSAAGPETEEEKSARMRWYVVHTYSGRENKVKDTIERMIRNSGMQDQFGKVLVATEEVAEMKKGKKKVSQRKLFPSYILIEMEMSDEAWGMIENVPGVTHFVGEGKKPFPIPKKEVDRILGRMVTKEGVVPEVPFTVGEHVKVVDGPFTDFSGIVDEINPERGKLKVLVSIFGRETPVELDFLQVKSL